MKTRPTWLSLLGVMLAFALVAAACGDDDTSASDEPAMQTPATTAESAPEAEPEQEPEPQPAPEPESDPESDPEPEPENAPAPENESAPQPGDELTPPDDECPLGRATQVADELTPIRIVLLPVVSVAPVVYGAQCGFFEKHGLDATTETASDGPAAAQLIAAGEADLGISAWHPLSAIWVNGGPFVVAIDGTVLQPAEGAVMVAADSDIQTLADLAGRTVSNAAPGSIFEVAFKAALQDAGMEVDAAELVVVPITEAVPAVLSGSVDAIVTTEPFTTIGISQGLKVIQADLFGGRIAEGSSGGFAALAPWAAQNEDTILRARAVWAEVAQLFNDNEEAYRSFLPTFTALTPELASVITLSEYRLTTEAANIQPSIDLTAAVGVIPETIDVTPLVVAPD